MQHIPGLVKVVVRKDFVGVVAETQYQAMVAARQLVVRLECRPYRCRPQEDFFEHMQQQPSKDALSVDSGDVETRACCCRQRSAGAIYLSLSNARFGGRVLCGG